MLKDLVYKNRSYRRFDQNHKIELETLEELVDLARHSASAANAQPLKFMLVCDSEANQMIFSQLGWAAYLKDWHGPEEGERPSAYIIVLSDTTLSNDFSSADHGIACQSILLGAVEKGLGGCMIASINRKQLRKMTAIADHLEILLVVALGKPKENIRIEYIDPDGDIKYWRDATGTHHVPKRKLEDIIIKPLKRI